MGLYDINFIDQSTALDFAINFNNNYLQYSQIGFGSRYVAQDWPYFPADHYVDMAGYDITNIGTATASNVVY